MFTLLTTSVWIAAALAKVFLLLVLLRLRQAGAHPWFTTYLVLALARNLALMAVSNWGGVEAYFYAYWYSQIVECLAMFLVAIEVMRGLFAPYDLLPKQIVYRALWTFGATALIAAALILFSKPGSFPFVAAVDRLDRGLSLITAVIFWLLYYYSELLGLSPRYLSYGITTGFVFYCTMRYLIAAGQAAAFSLPPWAGPVSFAIATVMWFSSIRNSILKRAYEAPAVAVEQP